MPNATPFALNPDHVAVVEGRAPFTPLPKAQTGCLALFFSVSLLIGALLTFATLSEWYVMEQFKSTGITTQAQVIERYSGNFRGIRTYFLRLRFENNEQAYENRVQVNAAQYSRYQVGEEAPIRYLPEDPTIVSVDWENSEDPTFQRILTGFTLIWNVTVLALLLGILGQYRKLLRLALGGKMLTGEIIQASGCNDDPANCKVTIRFRFQSPTGKLLNGEASQTRNDLKNMLPQRGTPIRVFSRDDRTYMVL